MVSRISSPPEVYTILTKARKVFKNKLAELAEQEQIKRWWEFEFILKSVLYCLYGAMSLAWGRVLLVKANQHVYARFKLGL